MFFFFCNFRFFLFLNFAGYLFVLPGIRLVFCFYFFFSKLKIAKQKLHTCQKNMHARMHLQNGKDKEVRQHRPLDGFARQLKLLLQLLLDVNALLLLGFCGTWFILVLFFFLGRPAAMRLAYLWKYAVFLLL